MTFEEYSREANKTATQGAKKHQLFYPALGLAGETGEVIERIKKVFRDKDGRVDEAERIEIIKELGDVLWYLNRIATDLGVAFEEVPQANIKKLHSRLRRGKIHGSGNNR